MIVRASADPDEIPPTMTSDSNMVRKARFNVPFAGLMFNAFGSIVEIPQGDDLSVAREGQYGGAHTECTHGRNIPSRAACMAETVFSAASEND